jgi:8-oxo-dGTP pyrophosphatase MutT (NUDIX family)
MRVRRDCVRLPSGEIVPDYYIWENPDAVIIVALRADGRVPVVRQYKHGVGEVVLEFPAGEVDPGEEPEEAARRELMEETGHVAGTWEQLATLVNHPSKETCRVHVFLAHGARSHAVPVRESTEGITMDFITLEQFSAAVRAGEVYVSAMVAAASLATARLSGDEQRGRP